MKKRKQDKQANDKDHPSKKVDSQRIKGNRQVCRMKGIRMGNSEKKKLMGKDQHSIGERE